MQAAFPIQQLSPMAGRPNLHKLMKVLRIICQCSQTTKSNLGPLGYLFVALPLEHYIRFTNVLYVQPNPTPDLPTLLDDQTDEQREQDKLNWQGHRVGNANIANMN